MAAYISKKSSWLRSTLPLLPAAGIALLLCILLDGPRLGFFYDFLLKLRPALPISRELLIIDSSVSGREFGDDILEPGAATSLFYTMAELGARNLIIQVPILGLSAGGNVGEEEILYRFDEEFSILSRNIRNLFDAIRMGSVAPNDSARYVGELVDLSEKGKERLVAALVRRDESSVEAMEKAAAFFGNARRPGDLQVQLIRTGGNISRAENSGFFPKWDEYSKAPTDRDGVLRRIKPVMAVPDVSETGGVERTLEHIIYAALKNRFIDSEIRFSDANPVLTIRNEQDNINRIIPLDRSGAVIFEVPQRGQDFRRIGITDFLAYDEADRSLRRFLLEGEALGIFQDIEGENNPGILYDYALSILDETASVFQNEEEKKTAWVEARNRYFKSLNDFLYSTAEMNLVMGYERIIASESRDSNLLNSNSFDTNLLDEDALIKMVQMRDSLISVFTVLRSRHEEVLALREKLENSLSSSFCILGNTRDVEASALLANSILTGRVIIPGEKNHLLLGALLSALLVCFIIKSLGPAATLGAGALFTLLIGIGFSLSFILTGLWLDPVVPVTASTTVIFFSFIGALIARIRYSRRFSLAYGPFISRSCLKSVIKAGKPFPSQLITVRTAVIAIKNSYSSAASNPPAQRTKASLLFQEKVSDLIKKTGGTIIGLEEDIVTVCFGSPLERIFLRRRKEPSPYEDTPNANTAPASKAIDFISEIVKHPDCGQWLFGLDMGTCTFAWTALSGYFAQGSAVQKARALSHQASRHKTRVVVSHAVNTSLPDSILKKLEVIKGD